MRLFLLALFLCITAAAGAQDVQVIPPTGQWVTDQAELLSDQEERQLGFRLKAFEDSTSNQIIVVTVPSLGGVVAAEYAVALGRAWGVGQGQRDNGVVLLVSRDDREVFIATGFGLEGAVPDVIASRIVRGVIVPRFREGRFYDGISGAVDALMAASAGEYDALPASNNEGIPFSVLVVLFIVIVIIVLAVSAAKEGGSDGFGGGGTRYRHRSGPVIIWGGGHHRGGGGFGGLGGGGGFGGGGFGGFGGGGGGFGGGGAGGSW